MSGGERSSERGGRRGSGNRSPLFRSALRVGVQRRPITAVDLACTPPGAHTSLCRKSGDQHSPIEVARSDGCCARRLKRRTQCAVRTPRGPATHPPPTSHGRKDGHLHRSGEPGPREVAGRHQQRRAWGFPHKTCIRGKYEHRAGAAHLDRQSPSIAPQRHAATRRQHDAVCTRGLRGRRTHLTGEKKLQTINWGTAVVACVSRRRADCCDIRQGEQEQGKRAQPPHGP